MNIEAKFRGSGPVERDLLPVVEPPRNGLSGAAIGGIAAVLAILLFLYLNGRRNEAAGNSQQPQMLDGEVFAAPPPPLVIPQALTTAEPVPIRPIVISPPMAAPMATNRPGHIFQNAASIPTGSPLVSTPVQSPYPLSTPETQPPFHVPPNVTAEPIISAGSTEPALIEGATADMPQGSSDLAATDGPAGGGQSTKTAKGGSAASRLSNRASVIPSGTIIAAVLETPIDTSRTGFTRAIVSRDAHGFDGRRILIPRGSRLVGEYQSDARPGANRVLVTWTKLLRPDGVVVRLDSPATDSLGGPGIPATVHSSFIGRFITSAFQSALYVGQTILGRTGTTVVINGQPASSLAAPIQGFLPAPERAPRLTVKQGALINVFVARDLDFSSGSSARLP